MIAQTGKAVSDSARRAEIIYAQARSQIDVRLWRAALGGDASPAGAATPVAAPLAMTTMVGLFTADRGATKVAPPRTPPAAVAATTAAPGPASTAAAGAAGLGSNARYSSDIASAARRTGIPSAALAAIIDAEAGKNRDGSWRTASRNTRSSAAGLGQFLSGTWKSEAERVGTWLNATAHDNGWIGANGQVLPAARAALLDLRDDARASINATADYASDGLAKLAAAGVAVGKTADAVARTAYLGHNLGIGDAVRFLGDGIGEGRARHLLDAQIGSTRAARRIADAGGAAAAHRGWLLEFIARHIDTSRFSN